MVDRGSFTLMKRLPLGADERVLSHASKSTKTPLPDTFSPTNYDVMCGRGKSCSDHIGNRRFRVTIDMHLARYAKATSKTEKSVIVSNIVDIVRESSPNGGFVKQCKLTGRWFEVGEHVAREKVGNALREALSSQRRASKTKHDVITSRRESQSRASIGQVKRRNSTARRESFERRDSLNSMDVMSFLQYADFAEV